MSKIIPTLVLATGLAATTFSNDNSINQETLDSLTSKYGGTVKSMTAVPDSGYVNVDLNHSLGIAKIADYNTEKVKNILEFNGLKSENGYTTGLSSVNKSLGVSVPRITLSDGKDDFYLISSERIPEGPHKGKSNFWNMNSLKIPDSYFNTSTK